MSRSKETISGAVQTRTTGREPDIPSSFTRGAPANATNLLTPSSPTSTTLEYIVPDDVSEQKDILVATPDETPGNHNSTLPLSFRHICTAVKFTTGSQMQSRYNQERGIKRCAKQRLLRHGNR